VIQPSSLAVAATASGTTIAVTARPLGGMNKPPSAPRLAPTRALATDPARVCPADEASHARRDPASCPRGPSVPTRDCPQAPAS
jgi:hypothetical protein